MWNLESKIKQTGRKIQKEFYFNAALASRELSKKLNSLNKVLEHKYRHYVWKEIQEKEY